LLKTEMATFNAINAWEEEYKEALKYEDKRIARIIAEKEAQRKELLNRKVKLKFRTMREATIDKIAKKLLDNVHKKRERKKIRNELYREEQMSKWTKEPAKLASRKQYAITENLKKMARKSNYSNLNLESFNIKLYCGIQLSFSFKQARKMILLA
ncbi:hypothetical protein X777_07069, partial [Ooceraea biroi]